MDSVIKRVITAREINHRGQGLWVSYKILQGDLNQVGATSLKLSIFLQCSYYVKICNYIHIKNITIIIMAL